MKKHRCSPSCRRSGVGPARWGLVELRAQPHCGAGRGLCHSSVPSPCGGVLLLGGDKCQGAQSCPQATTLFPAGPQRPPGFLHAQMSPGWERGGCAGGCFVYVLGRTPNPDCWRLPVRCKPLLYNPDSWSHPWLRHKPAPSFSRPSKAELAGDASQENHVAFLAVTTSIRDAASLTLHRKLTFFH